MIRLRFHGRGGQGVKTASRIVGSAAFLAGHQAQDSPIYGAERRGAPVAAFTRISDAPILERGVIESPDLLIVADRTLLYDPVAAVLSGQENTDAVFVNTEEPGDIKERAGIVPRLITFDVSGKTHESLGETAALSIGIGAAAARLTGVISEDHLLRATQEELEELRFPPGLTEKSLSLASVIFNALPAIELTPSEAAFDQEMSSVRYEHPARGTPSIFHPGNSELRSTGNWRIEEPVIDRDVCTRCRMCFVYCPDGAIALDEHGFPVIDYEHCKGCMICEHVCPVRGAITSKKEVHA